VPLTKRQKLEQDQAQINRALMKIMSKYNDLKERGIDAYPLYEEMLKACVILLDYLHQANNNLYEAIIATYKNPEDMEK